MLEQLWGEILNSISKPDVQHKLREFTIVPVIKELISQMMPYFIGVSILFATIIILLIIVIYNQVVK